MVESILLDLESSATLTKLTEEGKQACNSTGLSNQRWRNYDDGGDIGWHPESLPIFHGQQKSETNDDENINPLSDPPLDFSCCCSVSLLYVPSPIIMADTSRPVLILGGGCFGLATAYHLAQNGYSDITVLEKDHEVPSRFSAANDLNKVIRAEYADPFYTELALVSFLNCIGHAHFTDAFE